MSMFDANFFSYLLFFVGFLPLIIGGVVYLKGNKKPSDVYYLLMTICVVFWVPPLAAFQLVSGDVLAEAFLDMYLVGGTVLMLALLYFSLTFKRSTPLPTRQVLFLAVVPAMICLYIAVGEVFSVGAQDPSSFGKEFIVNDVYYFLIFFIILYGITSYIILYTQYAHSAGIIREKDKKVLLLIFLAVSTSTITNVISPVFGNSQMFLIGPMSVCLGVFALGHLIASYKHWDFKVFWTEVFLVFIVFVLGSSMFFVNTLQEFIVRLVFLVLGGTVGYILLSSVRAETKSAKEIEELLRKSEEKNHELELTNKRNSVFITTTANQLRDPLSGIRWHSSSILDGAFGPIPEKSREYVKRIFQSSKRLIVIVDDFLDLRKIEQKKMEYDFERFDMKNLVMGLVEEMETMATERKLEVVYEDDGHERFLLKADKGKVRQVISNLIDNAIKYTKKGTIHVSVEKKASFIYVRVRDQGMGMTQEEQKKLFRKFTRTNEAKKVNTTGSGLGLYVAHEIIKAHNGNIWAESPGLGKGSTFVVKLPLDRKQVEESAINLKEVDSHNTYIDSGKDSL